MSRIRKSVKSKMVKPKLLKNSFAFYKIKFAWSVMMDFQNQKNDQSHENWLSLIHFDLKIYLSNFFINKQNLIWSNKNATDPFPFAFKSVFYFQSFFPLQISWSHKKYLALSALLSSSSSPTSMSDIWSFNQWNFQMQFQFFDHSDFVSYPFFVCIYKMQANVFSYSLWFIRLISLILSDVSFSQQWLSRRTTNFDS